MQFGINLVTVVVNNASYGNVLRDQQRLYDGRHSGSVLTNPETRTAAVALQVFGATQEGGAIPVYGQLMAAALVCAVPVVVLYLVFQRYLVGGLTTGGVK